MEEHKITIRTRPKFKPMRMIAAPALQVGVIGIGVFTESSAMQWSKFAVLCLAAIASAARDKTDGMTFDEARAKIEELEAKSD